MEGPNGENFRIRIAAADVSLTFEGDGQSLGLIRRVDHQRVRRDGGAGGGVEEVGVDDPQLGVGGLTRLEPDGGGGDGGIHGGRRPDLLAFGQQGDPGVTADGARARAGVGQDQVGVAAAGA